MSSNLKSIENLALGLNEAQTKAVLNPLNSCTKIVAGAGTGKTKIISKRFTKLVLDMQEQSVENPQSKILVITFTDKAANEMKERIVNELEENGISTAGTGDLWISTFHSFCIRILKKYSIEAGLSPSFKMAEEKQLKEIYDNLIKRIKYGEANLIEDVEKILETRGIEPCVLSIESVKKLNCVCDLETLFEDIYGVVKKIKSLGVSPNEFLNDSLNSLKEFSRTVESTPFKFETKDEYVINWAEHFRKYTDDYCDFDGKTFDAIAGKKIVLDKFGKRKAIEYGMAQGFPENVPKIQSAEILLTKVIAAIYALYQNELEKRDLADFDDLINKTIQIFKENELVRSYFQKYFKQIIVDEFQDTNGAQLELIELLLNEEHPDLTFVGDRKQSIYSFRYAQMENLEVLHKNVQQKYGQNFEPINLSINYRSTPEVLNAVNYVTENELKLNNENLSANPHIDFSDTSKDVKITVIEGFENAFEQKIEEAKYIASEIENLKSRDDAGFKDFAVLVKSHAQADIVERELKKKNIPSVKKVNTGFFGNCTVKNVISMLRLVKNSEDEQALFRLLKIRLCDGEIFELKKSFDKKLLKNFEADGVKRLNLAQKFLTLQGEGLTELSASERYVQAIYETINFVRKNKNTMTLLQIFEKLRTEILPYGFLSEFEKEQAKNNLKILEKIIDDFAQNENYISVNSLLDYLEKAKDDRSFELPSVATGEIDAVQILTIHASKGLEFPYVFVLSIASSSATADKTNIHFDMQYGGKPGFGIMINNYKGKPSPKTLLYKELWKKPREKNEALRLFYVAVSRAKKYLNVLSFEPYARVKPIEYVQNLSEFLQ